VKVHILFDAQHRVLVFQVNPVLIQNKEFVELVALKPKTGMGGLGKGFHRRCPRTNYAAHLQLYLVKEHFNSLDEMDIDFRMDLGKNLQNPLEQNICYQILVCLVRGSVARLSRSFLVYLARKHEGKM
jgi:hypothetical protein